MCQLLGMNANTPTDAMFSFAGLACRANEHKDGFGIAFFEDRGLRHFIDARSAAASPVAELVKHYPIRSDCIVAHIRKATQGRVALENTHPFVPRLHAAFRPVGDTDSERALCWLMQELSKAHASVPTLEELTLTLAELMPVLAGHGSFNMLLSNGQALWAHASTKLHWLLRQHPFGAATLADADLSVDFAPLTTPGDRIALVATEPLTVGESWQAMVPGELRMFVGGLPAG
jgi:glutamine amidotransferase